MSRLISALLEESEKELEEIFSTEPTSKQIEQCILQYKAYAVEIATRTDQVSEKNPLLHIVDCKLNFT